MLGALDKFYNMLDETFYKAIINPKNAHLYQRVDSRILWLLLCDEAPDLKKHFDELKKIAPSISESVKSSKTLKMVLNMSTSSKDSSFLGLHLLSLISKTDGIVKSGKNIALSALSKVRKIEMMVKHMNVLPNTYYTEHLFQLICTYQELDDSREKLVEALIVKSKLGSLLDMQTIFLFKIQDPSLISTFSVNGSLPKFIQDHLKPDVDYVTIYGEQYPSMFGLGALVRKYWNALVTYKIQEAAYNTNVPFVQNIECFRSRINILSRTWLLSGNYLKRIGLEELRNLCFTYDFLLYYAKLIGAEYDFMPLKKALLTIIRTTTF